MPELTPEQRKPHDGIEAWLTFLSLVIEHSVDSELIERQRYLTKFHPERAPLQPGIQATLGVTHDFNGIQRKTHIGNVEKISSGTAIGLGASLGKGCIIQSRVEIEECAQVEDYSLLEHGVRVGASSIVEFGATLCTGARLEPGGVIGEGSEVGYGVCVTSDNPAKPYTIVTDSGFGNYNATSR